MAYTQADLDAIESAIANGYLRVRDHTGTEVEYRSFDDLRRVRDLIRTEMGINKNNGIRRGFARHSKGIC